MQVQAVLIPLDLTHTHIHTLVPSLCLTQHLDPINHIMWAPHGSGKDYRGKVMVVSPANGVNIVWAINNKNE